MMDKNSKGIPQSIHLNSNNWQVH